MSNLIEMAWDQVWQVTLLAGAVAILGALVRSRMPRLMYGLWVLVLIKCVIPPVVQHPLAAREALSQIRGEVIAIRLSETQIPMTLAIADEASALPVEEPSRRASMPLTRVLENQSASFHKPVSQQVVSSKDASDAKGIKTLQSFDSSLADLSSALPIASAVRGDNSSQSLRSVLASNSPFLVVCIWMAGFLIVSATRVRQVRRMRRWLTEPSVLPGSEISRRIEHLCDKLFVNSAISVRVSDRAASPFVFGLRRPTIVLPRDLVASNSDIESIDPILAHELMHVRRGDLWLGMFQNATVALWWFHPLVWWASRQLSIQSELLCDEAVIGNLRCSPSTYARRLLSVIESAAKRQTNTLPPRWIAPSMSAFGRTRQRLERIMRTNPRRRRMRTIIAAATVIALAVLVLPGDLTSDAQDSVPDFQATPDAHEPPGSDLPPSLDQKSDGRALTVIGNQRDDKQRHKIEHRKYDYRKAIDANLKAGHANERSSKRNIEMMLRAQLMGWDDSNDSDPDPEIAWIGSELHLFATPAQHEIAKQHAERKEFFGGPQISIEARFFESKHTTIAEVLDAIGTKWYAVPNSESNGIQSADDRMAMARRPQLDQVRFARWKASSTQSRSNSVPLLISFFDDNEMRALVTTVQEREDAHILQAPKVALFDSQQASIESAGLRPFVTSVSWTESEGAKPGIEVVRDGLLMHVMPHLLDRNVIGLRFACEQSRIPDVTRFDLPTKRAESRLETPHVLTKQFATDFTTRVGESVVLSWFEPQEEGDAKVRLVALTSRVIDYDGKFAEQEREWVLPSDSETAAMKRGLVPLNHFPGTDSFVTADESKDLSSKSEIPFPIAMRKQLEALGTRVVVKNLTSFHIHEGSAAILEADSIIVEIKDLDLSLMELQSVSLESKRLHLKLSDTELACEFPDAVHVRAQGNYDLKAGSGILRYSIAEQADGDLGSTEMSFDDQVQFSAGKEIQLSADRFELTNNSWASEGNVTLKTEIEPGRVHQIKGQRVEMSEDFPALIIERDPRSGPENRQ